MSQRNDLSIRWVFFDAVGTMIYPDPPVATAYLAAGRRFGSQLSQTEIGQRFQAAIQAEYPANPNLLSRPPTSEAFERDRWRRIVRAVIDDVRGAEQEELFTSLWRHFALPQHWRVFADVAPVLTELAERNYDLAIASNFDARLREIMAGHRSLQPCRTLFVSAEAGFTKPDHRFFESVVQQLQISPEQALLVGDDLVNDVVGATASGWQAVLLNRQLSAPGPNEIHSLRELLIRLPAQANS